MQQPESGVNMDKATLMEIRLNQHHLTGKRWLQISRTKTANIASIITLTVWLQLRLCVNTSTLQVPSCHLRADSSMDTSFHRLPAYLAGPFDLFYLAMGLKSILGGPGISMFPEGRGAGRTR